MFQDLSIPARADTVERSHEGWNSLYLRRHVCIAPETNQEHKWVTFRPRRLLQVIPNEEPPKLGKQCRQWKKGVTQSAVEHKLTKHVPANPGALYMYTDGAVREQSGWAYIAVNNENKIMWVGIGRFNKHKRSNEMEEEAVLHALKYLASSTSTCGIVLTDCEGITNKIEKELVREDWLVPLKELSLKKDFQLLWMYVPGHAGVTYNELADKLASYGCNIACSIPPSVPLKLVLQNSVSSVQFLDRTGRQGNISNVSVDILFKYFLLEVL